MGTTYDKVFEFKTLLKKFLKHAGANIHISCKNILTLDTFKKDVNSTMQSFIKRDPDSLKSISLFKGYTFDTVKWSLLFDMYNSTLDETETEKEIVDDPEMMTLDIKKNLDTLPSGFEGILNKNPAIYDMISELLPMVKEAMKGKDTSNIEPENLMRALTSGNLKNNELGIDLSKIFEKTSDLVNKKISSGELHF